MRSRLNPRVRVLARQSARAIAALKMRLCPLLALLLIVAAQAGGQQTALPVWQGVVRTAAGVPVAGVIVQLSNDRNHAQAESGSDGRFKLPPLPSGQYGASIVSDSRKIEYGKPVELAQVPESVAITILDKDEMTISSLKEENDSSGGEKLSSQAVSELPLNKRDFSQLLLLPPAP